MALRDTVLRQKVTPAAAPPPGQMSAEKLLAIAFGRAARELPGLGLRLTGFSRRQVDLPGLSAGFETGALGLLLLRRRETGSNSSQSGGAEQRESLPATAQAFSRPTTQLSGTAPTEAGVAAGLVICDSGLVAAMVEARLTGRVSPAPPGPREPTRIDALVVAGLVDAAMRQVDRLAGGLSIAPLLSPWQAGAMVPSAAAARLTLRDAMFHYFVLDFELGEGVRRGRLSLALPDRPDEIDEGETQKAEKSPLAQVVLQARGDLHAVLARMQVPLARISTWKAGHTIPIPRAILSGIRIEDIEGNLVGRGKLGQLAGVRAIRISAEVSAEDDVEFSTTQRLGLGSEMAMTEG